MLSHVGRNHLDRNRIIRFCMNAMVDCSHASLAQDADDFVRTDDFEIKRHVESHPRVKRVVVGNLLNSILENALKVEASSGRLVVLINECLSFGNTHEALH